MKDFAYACPATIEDAVAAMRADGARALAGGTDLIPQMREGRRQVACLVDLKRIPELTAISTRADGGSCSAPQPAPLRSHAMPMSRQATPRSPGPRA